MKPANTITTAILVSALAVGLASAQSSSVIQNTRNTMNAVSNRATAASNEALSVHPSAAPVTPEKTAAPVTVRHTGSGKHVTGKHINGSVAKHSAPPKSAVVEPAHPAVASTGAEVGREGGGEATEQSVVPDSKYSANGRRDPFISPVVSHAGGSGCSTGKKCLEIGAINLRGVVRSENGFIAVVSNDLNKAYFLRENDPVFNGYVVKITGDSIVFQETLQDRLGKTFTREVVKKITTPAV